MVRVSTGYSLHYTKQDYHILRQIEVDVKDMEAAAIASVASNYKKPFLAIKSITDFINRPEDTGEVFQKNLKLASSNLSKKIFDFIKLIENGNTKLENL